MLVEAHGPQRHDLAVGIGVELGQLLQEARLDAGQRGHLLQRVLGDQLAEGLEVRRLHLPRIGSTLGAPLELVLGRSEEHTSELQSLMRSSYAVFCLKQKK